MREQLQAETALTQYTQRHARKILTGILGNNSGTVDHATRINFVYVRLHGDPNQVIEAEAIASFPHVAGLVVAVELVQRDASSHYQVLGIATNILYVGNPWAGTVGAHAAQHERRDLGTGGFDPLDIYNRALVNLRARAQTTPDFTLYVERGFYFMSGILYEWAGGNSAAFTVPPGSFGVTGRRCDLLYFGSDHLLHIVQGTATLDGSQPAYPTTPYPCIPVAYVYMASSMTSIQETDIKDARVILTSSDGTPVAHNLLSATHSDTLTASVSAGDLVIGNDTPEWARLGITVPGANIRNILGVDAGETKPSWKAALDATNPTTIAESAAAAPGTSLIFSHRDHTHGAPATWAPTAHHTSHEAGGGDAVKLDDLATPDDNTDLNASITAHGLLPKLGGGTTNFLRADGTWNAPPLGDLGTRSRMKEPHSPPGRI